MKTIKYKIRKIICYIISKIPRNHNVAVYGSWFGRKFADNSKYLFLYANREHSFKKNIWITKNDEVLNELSNKGFECYLYNSFKGIYYQLLAKYVFICTGIDDVNSTFISGATIVNLWHGVPLKKVCNDDEINFAKIDKNIKQINSIITKNEYSVCTSKKFIDIYKSAFGKESNYILNFGQPRNDVFYDEQLEDENEFIQNIKYNGKRIILYMPTHRNEGKTIFPIDKVIDLNKLDLFCEQNNSIFLLKLHFYHQNDKNDLLEKCKNVINITNVNVDSQLLLKYSDILITDYSSCYIDYLLLNREIIFYPFDLKEYMSFDRDLYFDYFEATYDNYVYSYDELETKLAQSINNKISNDQEKLLDFFYDKQNRFNVSKRVIDFVKNIKR